MPVKISRRNGPEQAIVLGLGTCDTRDGMCGRVLSELANDGPTTGEPFLLASVLSDQQGK